MCAWCMSYLSNLCVESLAHFYATMSAENGAVRVYMYERTRLIQKPAQRLNTRVIGDPNKELSFQRAKL